MADSIHVLVLNRDGTMYDDNECFVSLPSEDGPIGVLNGHASMLCSLKDGNLVCRNETGRVNTLPISSGVAEVYKNSITVLVS